MTSGAPAFDASTIEASQMAMRLIGVTAWYGAAAAVRGVNLEFTANSVTAIIGPSGCGKSTLLRCLNRMHEVVKGARVEGTVLLDGQNIYAGEVDPASVRERVGMVFQRPNPFPTMTIWENVGVGPKLAGMRGSDLSDVSEWALKKSGLWEEVRDRLNAPAISLSGGQQQRLCIARCIAVRPTVLLMDEPCSALDPVATLRIEDLIRELARDHTVVVVTHNMHQAARVSDATAFMLSDDGQGGRLIEFAPTETIFTGPRDERTEAYLTGRFG
jgi:phosphate transport system ATP-binding protein